MVFNLVDRSVMLARIASPLAFIVCATLSHAGSWAAVMPSLSCSSLILSALRSAECLARVALLGAGWVAVGWAADCCARPSCKGTVARKAARSVADARVRPTGLMNCGIGKNLIVLGRFPAQFHQRA